MRGAHAAHGDPARRPRRPGTPPTPTRHAAHADPARRPVLSSVRLRRPRRTNEGLHWIPQSATGPLRRWMPGPPRGHVGAQGLVADVLAAQLPATGIDDRRACQACKRVVVAPAVRRMHDDDAWRPGMDSKAAVRERGAHAHDNAARDPCVPRTGDVAQPGVTGAATMLDAARRRTAADRCRRVGPLPPRRTAGACGHETKRPRGGEPPGPSSCPRETAAKGYSTFTALIRSARPCFASAKSIPVLGFE